MQKKEKPLLHSTKIYDSGYIAKDIASNSSLQAQAIALTIISVIGHTLVHYGFVILGMSIGGIAILGLGYVAYKAYTNKQNLLKRIIT